MTPTDRARHTLARHMASRQQADQVLQDFIAATRTLHRLGWPEEGAVRWYVWCHELGFRAGHRIWFSDKAPGRRLERALGLLRYRLSQQHPSVYRARRIRARRFFDGADSPTATTKSLPYTDEAAEEIERLVEGITGETAL